MKVEDLRKINSIAAYWDTLGWVDERISKLDDAEQYLRASWNLTQDGVVAGHLSIFTNGFTKSNWLRRCAAWQSTVCR